MEGYMKRNNKVKLPKNFFQKERPTMTASEALKDTIPVKWVNKKKSK